MKGLKKLVKRFETLMTVAAFAEAGEFERQGRYSRKMLSPREKQPRAAAIHLSSQ